jgi:hypothetical protein
MRGLKGEETDCLKINIFTNEEVPKLLDIFNERQDEIEFEGKTYQIKTRSRGYLKEPYHSLPMLNLVFSKVQKNLKTYFSTLTRYTQGSFTYATRHSNRTDIKTVRLF